MWNTCPPSRIILKLEPVSDKMKCFKGHLGLGKRKNNVAKMYELASRTLLCDLQQVVPYSIQINALPADNYTVTNV